MFMYKLKRIGYSTLLYIKSKGLKLKSQWNKNKYILKEIRSLFKQYGGFAICDRLNNQAKNKYLLN